MAQSTRTLSHTIFALALTVVCANAGEGRWIFEQWGGAPIDPARLGANPQLLTAAEWARVFTMVADNTSRIRYSDGHRTVVCKAVAPNPAAVPPGRDSVQITAQQGVHHRKQWRWNQCRRRAPYREFTFIWQAETRAEMRGEASDPALAAPSTAISEANGEYSVESGPFQRARGANSNNEYANHSDVESARCELTGLTNLSGGFTFGFDQGPVATVNVALQNGSKNYAGAVNRVHPRQICTIHNGEAERRRVVYARWAPGASPTSTVVNQYPFDFAVSFAMVFYREFTLDGR